jgi:transcriptional regulator with AAA-type ATPase domain
VQTETQTQPDDSFIPPFLQRIYRKNHGPHPRETLNSFTIPFSSASLEKIERIAHYHSSYLQNMVFYSHNNFEIHILTEASPGTQLQPHELERLGPQAVERLFVQIMALYQAAQSLELDFIDFDSPSLLPGGQPQFSIIHPGSPRPSPRSLDNILDMFRQNPHFKQLNPGSGDPRELFRQLESKYIFKPDQSYIYRYEDFAANILNTYPISELESGANLKININHTNPAQKRIIKTNLYHNHVARYDDVFLAALQPPPGQLPAAIAGLLPEEPEPREDGEDFVSIIDRLNLFLKKSTYRSMILMLDDIGGREDAEFLNYLLENPGTGDTGCNIILVCFDAGGDSIDFNLELNEKNVNLLEPYLHFESGPPAESPAHPAAGSQPPPADPMALPQAERFVARLMEENDLAAARAFILDYKEFDRSLPLQLSLAQIYDREKERRKIAPLLKKIGKSINASHDRELFDHYHYLAFIHSGKEAMKEEAERHYRQIQGKTYKMRAAVQLSDRYIYGGSHDKARTLLEEAAAYFDGKGYERDEIEAKSQLAKLKRHQQHFGESEKLYQNLFIKSEMKNYRLLSANIAVDLGNLYQERGNRSQAEAWYKRAMKIYQAGQNQNGIVLVKSNMLDIMKIKGHWRETKNYLESILAYDKERNAAVPLAIDYYNIAHLELLKHNFAGARQFIETAISLFDKNGRMDGRTASEILKLKLSIMDNNDEIPGWDFLKRNHRQLSRDQKIILDIIKTVRDAPAGSACTAVIDKVPDLESREEQYEIIAAVTRKYGTHQLLELLKALTKKLSGEKKNYYYYEYYYIYYDRIFKFPGQGRPPAAAGTLDRDEKERFDEIYYFFLKNQRQLSPNIVRLRELLDDREASCDVFQSAQLVGDYNHWKIPGDFFKSLAGELGKTLPTEPELVKLVIYETDPLFSFSNSPRFETLTDEIMSGALRLLDHLNLTLAEVNSRYASSEKAFYFYKTTKVIRWKISGHLLGILLLAFTGEEYLDYDIHTRHENFFKKFGSLIHRYYESNFKLNRKLDFIIGESPAINGLKQKILDVGKVNFPVFITGESGSGKELVAKAVHLIGSRGDKPFIPVNAAAIPDQLLEAELFGYKRGAFTGANDNKIGLIEAAHEGTLFLDEIADLPLNLQAKLLRVLQENEIRRLGETRTRTVNIRVVTATNKDLKQLIAGGQFREDLYFRLTALIVEVPPLRERKQDIPLLVRHFLKKYNFSLTNEQEIRNLAQSFKKRSWPGNVRELETGIMRFITYYPAGIEPDSPGQTAPDIQEGGLLAAREDLEIKMILQALRENGWNRSKAARALKISRQYIFKLIKKYGITDPPS